METKENPVLPDNDFQLPYFAPRQEPIWKFTLLSLSSFGIYTLMWYYRQFKWLNEKNQLGISPFWRSFFCIFFCYRLFSDLQFEANRRGVPANYGPGLLAAGYIIISLLHQLPDPYWLVSLLDFLLVIPVGAASNGVLAKDYGKNSEFQGLSALEWGVWLVGAVFTALAIWGTFLPE